MITLIKNAHLISPKDLGKKDILLSANKIAAIENSIDLPSLEMPLSNCHLTVIDAEGYYLTPGFVDSLVHITGGGGEGGFTTRTPQMNLSDATSAGITTVIGALGTDAITRSLPDLLAKTKALNEEGISCYCYTGSYQVPVKTLLPSVMEDIVLISEFIGVGEVAIADHRSSQPSATELAKIASEARVGGLLSGKKGIVSIHCGDGEDMFSLLHQVVDTSDIPISQFYPTHVNRNSKLFDASADYAKSGGFIDLTTSSTEYSLQHGEMKCSKGLKRLLEKGVPVSQITFSSDGHASLPDFDEDGRLIQLLVGDEKSLFKEVRDAVLDESVEFEQAISVITQNPADILGLQHKGRIEVGADADCVLLRKSDLTLDTVIALGQVMVERGKILVKGRFEK